MTLRPTSARVKARFTRLVVLPSPALAETNSRTRGSRTGAARRESSAGAGSPGICAARSTGRLGSSCTADRSER